MRAGSSEELGGSYASGCYGAAMGSLLPACILNRAWVGHSDYGGYYHQPTYSRKKGAWATRPFGGGCAPACYARLRSAAPEGGLGGGKKSNLQNYVYTNTRSHPKAIY